MKKVLTGLLAVLIAVSLTGCPGAPSDDDTDVTTTPAVRKEVTGKLGKYEGAYEPGDIVFTDGTATPYSADLTLTAEQKDAAIAIIFYKGTDLNNEIKVDGKTTRDTTTMRTLGVGLHKSQTPLDWATFDYDGHTVFAQANAGFFKLTPLEVFSVWDGDANRYEFRFGNRNGKDHLQKLGEYLDYPYDQAGYRDNPPGDDTDDPALYPAFYFAKNYKDIDGNLCKGNCL